MHSLGSLQDCPGVPDELKGVYRTLWDVDPAILVDMAIDRAPYIDQSQSLTLGVRRPTPDTLVCFLEHGRFICSSLVFQKELMLRAWRGGLKTGLYYLRTLHPAFLDSNGRSRSGGGPSAMTDCCT